jgi:hypothetical protein
VLDLFAVGARNHLISRDTVPDPGIRYRHSWSRSQKGPARILPALTLASSTSATSSFTHRSRPKPDDDNVASARHAAAPSAPTRARHAPACAARIAYLSFFNQDRTVRWTIIFVVLCSGCELVARYQHHSPISEQDSAADINATHDGDPIDTTHDGVKLLDGSPSDGDGTSDISASDINASETTSNDAQADTSPADSLLPDIAADGSTQDTCLSNWKIWEASCVSTNGACTCHCALSSSFKISCVAPVTLDFDCYCTFDGSTMGPFIVGDGQTSDCEAVALAWQFCVNL